VKTTEQMSQFWDSAGITTQCDTLHTTADGRRFLVLNSGGSDSRFRPLDLPPLIHGPVGGSATGC